MKKTLLLKNRIIILFIISIILISLAITTCKIVKPADEIIQLSAQSESQMMGYIIKTINNKLIIIDGGTQKDSENLLKYIKKHNRKVDAWFITHPHIDHMGAFCELLSGNYNISVEKVYTSLSSLEWYKKNNDDNTYSEVEEFFNIIQNEKIKNKIIEVNVNDEIVVDDVKVEILGIKNEEIIVNSINNSSIILKTYIKDKSILFLGDSGEESGRKFFKNTTKEKIKSDYVQMAHHGQAGVELNLYKIINPTYLLWPTPIWLWNNDSGNGEDSGNWKTKQTREFVKSLNIKKNYISKDGDITIKIE